MITRKSERVTETREHMRGGAGAALLIAALVAHGTSEIEDIHHIERGYENICEKLQGLGANIKKVILPDSEMAKAL